MDSHGLVYLKPPSSSYAKPRSNTETTSKTTYKNTGEVVDNNSLQEKKRQLMHKRAMPP
jgi:hypothetical protein